MKSEPEPRSPTWISSPAMGGALEPRCSLLAGALCAPLMIDRAGTRAGNGAGDVADKLLERGHGGGGEIWPGDGDIDVEIGDGVVEGVALLLNPFGRADEAFLFGVPTAKDDGAAGTPALMEQSADAVNGFKHGGGAAGGIDRAVDPRVAMIADDDRVSRDPAAPGIFPMTSQMMRRW